jgi:Tfp pilus assembly protein FimT
MRSRVVPTRLSSISSNEMRGLSTLELVVSVGIILTISAIAIPSITKALRIYQLNDAATQLAGILKLTRFEAIRRNTPINCVNTQAGANTPANVWSDSNGDGIEQPTEKQILLTVNATLVPEAAVPNAAGLAGAIGVATTTAVNPASGSVQFDQRGAVSPAAVYVIYVGNISASNSGFRAVVVLPSGSVQVWTYAGGASNVWQQSN